MDCENISQLISSNVEATQYFNSLSAEIQQKILDRGTGVNTLDKLKEFKNLVENNGPKYYFNYKKHQASLSLRYGLPVHFLRK